jgi:hypothetical protein
LSELQRHWTDVKPTKKTLLVFWKLFIYYFQIVPQEAGGLNTATLERAE